MGWKDIVVNGDDKTISFSGHIFKEWGHIRWLRHQLEIMEANAEKLWGNEKAVRALEIQRECASNVVRLSVIASDMDADEKKP